MTEDQTTTTEDTTTTSTPDPGNAEAAKWRRRLREAEAERDAARAEMIDAQRQAWVRQYADTLNPWEAPILFEHLEEVTGDTAEEVVAAASNVLFEHRDEIQRPRFFGGADVRRGFYSGASAGGDIPAEAPSWQDVGAVMRQGLTLAGGDIARRARDDVRTAADKQRRASR